jgi:hypothetical protein
MTNFKFGYVMISFGKLLSWIRNCPFHSLIHWQSNKAGAAEMRWEHKNETIIVTTTTETMYKTAYG